MNWYKDAAYGSPPEAKISPSGTFIAIYNSFPIKDQLKNMSSPYASRVFQWMPDQPGKPWAVEVNLLKKDNRLVDAIEGLGVSVRHLLGGSSQPDMVQTSPAQSQQPSQQSSGAQHITNWILGKIISLDRERSGNPVVLAQIYTQFGPLGWVWKNKEGGMGIVQDEQDIYDHVEFIPNRENPLSDPDPSVLFTKFEEMFPETEDEDDEEAVKGRIPEKKISVYQKEIESTFADTNNDIIINALAGTGKTTTLRHLASFKPPNEKWLYLVFGKQNQKEAIEKFPPGVEVYTSHAFLGSRVLRPSSEAGVIPETSLDSRKLQRLIDEEVDSFPKNILFAAKIAISKICSLAKNNAANPNSPGIEAQLLQIIKKYRVDMDQFISQNTGGIDYVSQVITEAAEILRLSMPGSGPTSDYEGKRDHDDTLWYATLDDSLIWPVYNVVLADEVQDFNKCQTIMLQKLSERGARIIAVGDPNQAIYMFRGADSDAFQNVQSVVTGSQNGGSSHSIPVNYRCGKAIIDYVNQNTHVNELQAGRDFDGEVHEGKPLYDAMDDLFSEWETNGRRFNSQTALIGRTNRPLVECALQFLRNNVDFKIVGKDMSKELVDIIKKISASVAVRQGKSGRDISRATIDIRSFAMEMQHYVADMTMEWTGKASKHDELQELTDRSESLGDILSFLSDNGYSDPINRIKISHTGELIDYLRKKFSGADEDRFEQENKGRDPTTFVTLTSAHRSKGLEFKRVFIVDKDNFPSPRAQSEDELKQEANAWYVALTRAQDNLNILEPPPRSNS